MKEYIGMWLICMALIIGIYGLCGENSITHKIKEVSLAAIVLTMIIGGMYLIIPDLFQYY